MTPNGRLNALHGVRLQIEALIAEEEADMASQPLPDPEACPSCGAPAEKQVSSSTLDGKKSVMCIACKRERIV